MNTSMAILSALLLSQSAAEPAPWERHGALEVSENGHYIQHVDGTPFLWIGDTGWAAFQQLTREEVDHYLDHRAKLGFTVIQAVAHWSPHGGGAKRSPNNAPNAYGHRPFTGTEALPRTDEPLVVKGGGPTAPNDYWDHADYIVAAVRKRNMYLALLPMWSAHLVTTTKEYTEEEARSFGTFLGSRYRDVPNIIWVLGGDTKAKFVGYNKYQKYEQYDFRHIYRSMAEGLAFGVTGTALAWNQPHQDWDKLFLTYHPNGDYPYGSAQWFHKDVWQDANGIEVWRKVQDIYQSILDHYQLQEPTKPALLLEGSYEFGSYRHECGWVTPVSVRRQFYQTFFALGAGHTYGAAPIWAMRGHRGDYNCGYTWKQALDFPGAFQIATIAKDILQNHSWPHWVPNGQVLSGFSEGKSLKAAVTSIDKGLALVYFSNNSHITVNNVLKQRAKAYWIDPRDGRIQSINAFKVGESRVMAPPERWEDAILVLKNGKI